MQFITPVLLLKSGETVGKKVYVSEESAKRTEFYQAKASGHKIEKVLIIRKFEYGNEEIIKYGNETYTVLRSYDPQDGNIELYLIKEVRKYQCAAVLMWNVVENGSIISKSQNVFVMETGNVGQSFNISYQAGINTSYSFKMTRSDFELSRRIDNDTKKPLYASMIKFNDAIFDIVQTNFNPDINEVEIVCS